MAFAFIIQSPKVTKLVRSVFVTVLFNLPVNVYWFGFIYKAFHVYDLHILDVVTISSSFYVIRESLGYLEEIIEI